MRAIDYTYLVEPNLLIPGKKPVGNVKVDWENSLTDNIIGFWPFHQPNLESPGRNIVSNRYNTRPRDEWADQPNPYGYDDGNPNIRTWGNASLDHRYIDVNDELFAGTGPFTIACKFMRNSAVSDSYQIVLGRRDGTAGGETIYLYIIEDSGNDYLRFWVEGLTAGAALSDPTAAPLNEWITMVGVFSGSALTIYTNGVEAISIGCTGTRGSSTSTTTEFGASPVFADSQYQRILRGLISYVGIWHRVLTPSEILSMYEDPYQFLIPE